MNAQSQPVLEEREWDLVLNLLEQERADLQEEIHHTDSWKFREDLNERMKLIRGLIDRLQKAEAH